MSDRITLLGRRLFELKKKKSQLKSELSEIETEINRIATGDLARLMLDSEVEKHTLKGLGTIYLKDEFYCSVLAADQPELLQWLRANGHGDIIKDTVHPGTLKAFARDLASQGDALPDFFKISVVPTVATLSG